MWLAMCWHKIIGSYVCVVANFIEHQSCVGSNIWQPHYFECWHWLLPIVAAVCVLCGGFISGAAWHHYMGGEQHSNCICMAYVSNSVALVLCAELLVVSCFNGCAALEMVLCFCVRSTGLITKGLHLQPMAVTAFGLLPVFVLTVFAVFGAVG